MWKAFPKCHSMAKSFWYTCHGQQKQKITARVYESLKNQQKGMLASDETKKKMSLARKGNLNSFYGKTHSEEFKQKQSERMKIHRTGKPSPFEGHSHSNESRKKTSESLKGKMSGEKNHMYGKSLKWITDGLTSKRISADTELPKGWTYGRK